MDYIELLKLSMLALLQGIAEFLPISSSGHLAIVGKLFDIKTDPALVNIVLHAGTLLAILIYYRREILALFSVEKCAFIPFVIIASIPVALVGGVLKVTMLAEAMFNMPVIAGCGLLVTGVMLLFCEKSSAAKSGIKMEEMTFFQALLIGIAQAVALVPGVSRSGSTISAALKLGVKKADAAAFSFLLAIPAIAGATMFKLISSIQSNSIQLDGNLLALLIGFAISAIVGYISLVILIKVLKKGKLSYFGYYCLVIGVVVILWQC